MFRCCTPMSRTFQAKKCTGKIRCKKPLSLGILPRNLDLVDTWALLNRVRRRLLIPRPRCVLWYGCQNYASICGFREGGWGLSAREVQFYFLFLSSLRVFWCWTETIYRAPPTEPETRWPHCPSERLGNAGGKQVKRSWSCRCFRTSEESVRSWSASFHEAYVPGSCSMSNQPTSAAERKLHSLLAPQESKAKGEVFCGPMETNFSTQP